AVPAEIREKGSLVLSARLFGEIIRKMPDDVVVFTSENYMVNIKCGLSEFNILGTDPEEFPELPSVEEQNGLTIGQPVLRSMIAQTLFAVSDNESRPVHTGSLFEVDESGLTVVSVDGYRLALRHEPVDSSQGVLPFSFVVPGSALSEVEKICAGEDAVSVAQGARHIQFQAGDTVLVCRRLEGEFLAYKNAIPRNNTIKIEGDARTLLQSIERVSLIISDKLKSPLRCVFGDGMLSITTKTGIGDAADQCPITGDGQGLEIGFNNKYLMDALKAAPADRLRLEFTSGVAPCVILPAEGEENFVYMVLPVRLKAN
ncbi:DNA polymerase III subunit beta, partial [Clostridium phoceensis]